MTNKTDDVIEIDLLRLVQALWRRIWVIVLAVAIFGVTALAIAVFFITPQYKASVLMYVNSSDISLGGTKVSISQGELNAAQSLVDTYEVILYTRTTLNDVIEQAGVSHSYEKLVSMISADAVNSTEVFQIDVRSPIPAEAMNIANTIAVVLPEKIASIVEGSSARIVDMAVEPERRDSPSYRFSLMIGMFLGAVLSCGVIIVMELMDDKIHNTDYLAQTYDDIPILAVIPDLLNGQKDTYGDYQAAGKSAK